MKITIELPEGVTIESMTLGQAPDSCQDEDSHQRLKVDFDNAGGGHFYRLSSEGWSSDKGELVMTDAALRTICEANDKDDEEVARKNR